MNEINFTTWEPADNVEVRAVVEEKYGVVSLDLHEPERILPRARLLMTKTVAAALIASLSAVMTGCAGVGRMCDEARVDFQYTHISHPLAGAPFGPKDEEDAVHTLGPMGRCTVGRGYVDLGLGWKLKDSGFYGPGLTGSVNVGVNLWSSKN